MQESTWLPSCPDGPKPGEGDCFRIRCADVVGLLYLPAGLVPDQFAFVPLVPAPYGHQAALAAQAVALHSLVGTFICCF